MSERNGFFSRANPGPRAERWLFWGLAAGGATCYCLYARSWRDWWRILYDVPASLAVFSFAARVLITGLQRDRSPWWLSRAWLLLPLVVVPAGREFLGWRISGHLTDAAIAAGGQIHCTSSPRILQPLYWLVVLTTLSLRWVHFDEGDHWQTYRALVVASGALLISELIFHRLSARRVRRTRCTSGGKSDGDTCNRDQSS
ncbi:MAG: hypothetical protein JSV79_09635 [Armatimonadota bacterium]|nr:MAG: hypothetical protein JSV79_09635 [Armatimonadota bacterium]